MISSVVLRRRLAVFAVCAGLAAVAGGCDWLLGLDKEPPTCRWRSPADSSYVSGTVLLQVDAVDSIGVAAVDFYADGSLAGTDSMQPFSAVWDAGSLPDRSWHRLWAVATDLAGNQGYSDTLAVQVLKGGQRSIYHGTIEVPTGSYQSTRFDAQAGDTLAGDLRVQSGNLSRFIWLDAANFQRFQDSQSYTPIYEVAAVSEHSVRQAVPAAGQQYVVFLNTEGSNRIVWVRFTLE